MIDYTLPLDQLPDPLPIEPLRKPFDVTITPPGSKSITCRAYVLAALAHGESKIIRPLRADDPDYLLKALCTLGAEARWVPGEDHDGEDVFIKGVGGGFPRGGNLYLGDGGAPTRFMIACACLAAEPVMIDASPRMRERPIAEGVEMLRQLGARIEYVEEEGRLPVRVVPSELSSQATVRVGKTQSSQFISAMILIGTAIPTGLTLDFRGNETLYSYVTLTMQVVREWNRTLTERFDRDGWRQLLIPVGQWPPGNFQIEPDASSAVYWLTAAAMGAGSRVQIAGLSVESAQPDATACHLISGPCFLEFDTRSVANHFDVTGPARVVMEVFPCWSVPDAAVAIAVLASVVRTGTSKLIGLESLRVKETDRIAALASELRKVGCTVETGEDWIEITPIKGHESGSSSLRSADPAYKESIPTVIETYNDHRMAMAFAVLGLVRPGISIRNPACVSKSYPGFWKDFAKLYQ